MKLIKNQTPPSIKDLLEILKKSNSEPFNLTEEMLQQIDMSDEKMAELNSKPLKTLDYRIHKPQHNIFFPLNKLNDDEKHQKIASTTDLNSITL